MDVTALVGHEISTPIATALLYIRIAESHQATESAASSGLARAALEVARGEVERLKRLVDRVIEIERHGRPIMIPASIDAGAAVREAVDRGLAAVGEPPVRPTVLVDARLGLVGLWDEAAIDQIVRNLLSNALKFGQGRPVHVAVGRVSGGIRLVVRDRGVGIRAADRERIFQRSARAPSGEGGGLGFGLWLVRELAGAHGGRVAVQSRLGQGATFTVVLPQLRVVAAIGREVARRALAGRPPRARPGAAAELRAGRRPALAGATHVD